MKLQDDILEMLTEFLVQPELDPFSFRREALLEFTSKKTLKCLKKRKKFKGDIPDEWDPLELTHDSVLQRMKLDLYTTWDKLGRDSAHEIRLTHHLEVYLWLLEDMEHLEMLCNSDEFASRTTLAAICQHYDFPIPSEAG